MKIPKPNSVAYTSLISVRKFRMSKRADYEPVKTSSANERNQNQLAKLDRGKARLTETQPDCKPKDMFVQQVRVPIINPQTTALS